MYSINYIQKNVLITSTECQQKFGNAISPEKWNAAIEVAEARFVQPLLGYDLYTDLCSKKNVAITSGNIAAYQDLIDAQFPPANTVALSVGMIVNALELLSVAYQALWKQALYSFVYECVYFMALSKNYAEFTAQGIVKNNPVGSLVADSHSNSVGVGLRDLKWLEDRALLDYINPLQAQVELYMCMNKADLPLYDSACNCKDYNPKSKEKAKRTTSFIDIYPDDCDYNGRIGYNRDWEQ